MKYEVVSHQNEYEFQQEVNARLALGWILVGGMSVAVFHRNGDTNTWRYMQAMVLDSATA
jgi:hypothetical protein